MLHRLSLDRALDLWSELEEALHGTNSFGGDTAELYIYRFMPHQPLLAGPLSDTSIAKECADETYRQANETLHALLAHFAEKRQCSISVDGKKLGPWVAKADNRHRVHVRVIEKKDRKGRHPDPGARP